jgi:hypothetical protein
MEKSVPKFEPTIKTIMRRTSRPDPSSDSDSEEPIPKTQKVQRGSTARDSVPTCDLNTSTQPQISSVQSPDVPLITTSFGQNEADFQARAALLIDGHFNESPYWMNLRQVNEWDNEGGFGKVKVVKLRKNPVVEVNGPVAIKQIPLNHKDSIGIQRVHALSQLFLLLIHYVIFRF